MSACRDKLLRRMIDEKVTNGRLMGKAGFSASIITRIKRNRYISPESNEAICRTIDCGVDDIPEFTEEDDQADT